MIHETRKLRYLFLKQPQHSKSRCVSWDRTRDLLLGSPLYIELAPKVLQWKSKKYVITLITHVISRYIIVTSQCYGCRFIAITTH